MTILTFADEPVTGSYKVDRDCRGTATITPKSEMHFSFVVVDCGKEMLAVETDTDTVVSGTLQHQFQQEMSLGVVSPIPSELQVI